MEKNGMTRSRIPFRVLLGAQLRHLVGRHTLASFHRGVVETGVIYHVGWICIVCHRITTDDPDGR